MLTCPKCGGDDVQGPTYCPGCSLSGFSQWAREHLHYRCVRCGYVTREQCRDHEETAAKIRRQLPDYPPAEGE